MVELRTVDELREYLDRRGDGLYRLVVYSLTGQKPMLIDDRAKVVDDERVVGLGQELGEKIVSIWSFQTRYDYPVPSGKKTLEEILAAIEN